jgi:tRNA intron endonuclease, catalytic C-terminal domain
MKSKVEDSAVSLLIAFSSELNQKLLENRLPPTYVGVPRCRPSSKEVHLAWRGKSDVFVPRPKVAYLVKNEDGTERRMNTQEKKEARKRMLEEMQVEREKIKEMKKNSENIDSTCHRLGDDTSLTLSSLTGTESLDNLKKEAYYHVKVDSAAIKEELADLRRDREGVPPVALMPCMALQTSIFGVTSPTEVTPELSLDFSLAEEWSILLRDSFRGAEEIRSKEDIRPMAYKLVPEPWQRMMPTFNEAPETCTLHNTHQEKDWELFSIRHRMNPLDSDKEIICSLLYTHTKIHIGCGAKFGSDFLLYDGPRKERHAFAGLRVVLDGETPRAYDLHGYVRCLNTAGKLSLLAKVVRHGNAARVAFVDLALEKILTAPRHAKRGVKEARREVAKHLSKASG